MDLPIVYSEHRGSFSGSFDAKVEDGALVVAADLRPLFERLHISTAGQLMTVTYDDPIKLAMELDWSEPAVREAREILLPALQGKVPDRILNPPPPTQRPFGARPPNKRR